MFTPKGFFLVLLWIGPCISASVIPASITPPPDANSSCASAEYTVQNNQQAEKPTSHRLTAAQGCVRSVSPVRSIRSRGCVLRAHRA